MKFERVDRIMITKRLMELVTMDSLSQETSWAKLYAAVKDTKEDIEIDFSDIIIQRPLSFPSFKLLLQMPNVHMKFKNDIETVKAIKAWMILNGDGDNFENKITLITVEKPVQKTKDQIKLEKFSDIVYERFEKDESNGDGAYAYNIMKSGANTAINNYTTFQYIGMALDRLRKETEVKSFTLNLTGVTMADGSLCVKLAELRKRFEKDGVSFHILVDDDNKALINSLKRSLYTVSGQFTSTKERYKYIKSMLNRYNNVPIPGMLKKYKESRAVDVYGRQGNGECEWCRIALLKGISVKRKPDTNEVTAIMLNFITYYEDKFFTKLHWESFHDGEKHPGLGVEKVSVPLSAVGITDMFLGSQYYFNFPTQHEKDECIRMVTQLTDRGTTLSEICTIPERMKLVFDDFNIKYCNEIMQKSIEETQYLK